MKFAANIATIALALTLAACGSSTTNEAAANDTFANDVVLNDEMPADGNALVIDNAADAALIGNGASDDVLTATDNTL